MTDKDREERSTKLEHEIAVDFYVQFQTVCQRERDDALPNEVAQWVMKWINR